MVNKRRQGGINCHEVKTCLGAKLNRVIWCHDFYFKTKTRIGACQFETRRNAREKIVVKCHARQCLLLPVTFCTFAMGVRFNSNVAKGNELINY